MKRKGDPDNKGAAQRAKFRPQSEFVRFVLGDDEKAVIKDTAYSAEQMAEDLEELVQAGYKVTFRWDDYGDCSGCWLVAPDRDSDNSGYILAGRGSSSQKAFKQAVFVHRVKFKEIWPKITSNGPIAIDD
jgi:hypothetical protein